MTKHDRLLLHLDSGLVTEVPWDTPENSNKSTTSSSSERRHEDISSVPKLPYCQQEQSLTEALREALI